MTQLRNHAMQNPDRLFPLNSCTQCLACDLTGKTMDGYYRFVDGSLVDPHFAALCNKICIEDRESDSKYYERKESERSLHSGAEIASRIDALVGEHLASS